MNKIFMLKQVVLAIISVTFFLILAFVKAEAGQYTGRWEGITSQGLPIALSVSDKDVITQIEFDHKVTFDKVSSYTSTYSFNALGFDIKISSDGSFSTENIDGEFNEEDTILFDLGGEHSEGIKGTFRGSFIDSTGSGSWTGYWYRLICDSHLYFGYAFFLAEDDYFFRFEVNKVDEPGSPVPDIKANGSDGLITLLPPDRLIINVTLNNSGRADNADWWLAADTPFGLYFLALESWTSNWLPAYQGLLFYLDSFEVLNVPVSGLPAGIYTIYFGIDTNMDGEVTGDSLYSDSVVVEITN